MSNEKALIVNIVGPNSEKKDYVKNALIQSGYNFIMLTTSSLKNKFRRGGEKYKFAFARNFKNNPNDYVAYSTERGYYVGFEKKQIQENNLVEMDYEMTFQCFAIPCREIMVITVYIQTQKETVLECITRDGIENISTWDCEDEDYQRSLQGLADYIVYADGISSEIVLEKVRENISCFECKKIS